MEEYVTCQRAEQLQNHRCGNSERGKEVGYCGEKSSGLVSMHL